MTKPKPTRSRRKSSETAGDRLRQEILAEYELSPSERVLLDRAAALVDQLTRIDGEIAGSSLVTIGSAKQDASHPLIRESRNHSLALARILAELRLPDESQESGESVVSLQARRAAQERWRKAKGGAS